MKRKSSLGLFLVIVGVLALVYTLTNQGENPLKLISKHFTHDVYLEDTFDLETIKNLSIQERSVNIIIQQSSGTQGTIRLDGYAGRSYAKKLRLAIEQREDTLFLGISGDKGWKLFDWQSLKLTIELPEKQWNDVNLIVSSGNITMHNLLTQTIDVKTTSGNINMDNIKAAQLSAYATSGNIQASDVEGADHQFKTTSGNISVKQYLVEQLGIKVTSGNIKALEGIGELNANTTSGNITVEADDLLHDTTLKSTSGNVTVALHNDPRSLAIDYDGSSGNGRINKSGFQLTEVTNDRDDLKGAFGSGDIKLHVRTTSGNFTLK